MTTVGNHEVGSVVVDLFWCRLLVLPADGLPRHCSCIPLRLVPPTALAVDTAEVSMPLVWCPLWAPRRPPSLAPCAALLRSATGPTPATASPRSTTAAASAGCPTTAAPACPPLQRTSPGTASTLGPSTSASSARVGPVPACCSCQRSAAQCAAGGSGWRAGPGLPHAVAHLPSLPGSLTRLPAHLPRRVRRPCLSACRPARRAPV